MPRVEFTANLRRLIEAPTVEVDGSTVRTALEQAFARSPSLRGYVLDEQGALRKHVMIFVDGESIGDRAGLSDPVGPSGRIFVMQALSGG
ncbi:MAG TPA: MoaD/ThiS family protein [Myxococcales bacterium]|nr:MoaD/ThiS family protein [Myxococcales bacterium]